MHATQRPTDAHWPPLLQLKMHVSLAREWDHLDAASLAQCLKRLGYTATVKEAPAPPNLAKFKSLRHQYLTVALPGACLCAPQRPWTEARAVGDPGRGGWGAVRPAHADHPYPGC